MTIVKTHSYSINLDNCLYWRSVNTGTLGFKLTDGTCISTTCPYQRGVDQIERYLKYSRNSNNVIVLSYNSKPIAVKRKPFNGEQEYNIDLDGRTAEEVIGKIVKKMGKS